MLDGYNIKDDYYFERYFEEKDLSEDTAKTYEKDLIKFCKSVNKELKDIINECKAQQSIETEEILSSTNDDGTQVIQKRIIKFDADSSESLVMQYFKQFERYCKLKGNKNTTINSCFDTISAVLSYFKVELPNFPRLKDDAKNWELLSKEDFKFILADSSLMHKSLTLFMLSTGFRISDCLNLTIGEYMEATSDYHDFVDVDDFIDNAPDDMMGFWDFEPQKTIKDHTRCKTFNSPESNKFILQNLRRLKNEYMPRKSEKIKKELKLTKSDALFGSKRGYYKKSPTVQSISTMFGRKNKELYAWHINKIHQNIKEGKISDEDYEKYVELIPKFHPHACRKYFCSIIQRHTSNERRYRLMEGHAPKNKLDKSYIEISKNEIAETYKKAVGDLSIYHVDEIEIEELRKQFNEKLNKQDEKHQEEVDSLRRYYEDKISSLTDEVGKTSEMVTQIRKKSDKNYIRETIKEYFRKNYKNDVLNKSDLEDGWVKCIVIQDLAYKYALNDDFDESPEALNRYIKKAIVQTNLHPELVEQMIKTGTSHDNEMTENRSMNILFNNLCIFLKTHGDIWAMVDDEDRLKTVFFNYIRSSNYDITEITDKDLNQISEDVMMEYLG